MSRRGRHTIRVRLALASAALIAGCIAASLALVYWATVGTSRQELDRSVQAELEELVQLQQKQGSESLEGELAERMQNPGASSHFLYLYSEESRILVGNMSLPKELEGVEGRGTFVLEQRSLRAHRVLLDDGRDLVVARDVTQSRSYEKKLLMAILLATGLAIVLAIGMGLALSHNLLRRVERMNTTLVSILHGEREARVEQSGRDDEFEELARHFNSLLNENEHLMAEMREVTDNIAHDLRTPLARLRGRVETALVHTPGPGACTDALQDVLAETNSLLDTFQALLNIAKIESGALRESMVPVDLMQLVRDAVELYEPVADEAGVTIEVDAQPGLMVTGNRHLLSQALTNLLDNAIKFSPRSARVEVRARQTQLGPELRVADSGPGVPEEDREHVLGRFVRLDASRHQPGTGLGLSLVAAVAKLHGARLSLEDNAPGLAVVLSFDKAEA